MSAFDIRYFTLSAQRGRMVNRIKIYMRPADPKGNDANTHRSSG